MSGAYPLGDAVLSCAVRHTSAKFHCALSQLPSRYPDESIPDFVDRARAEWNQQVDEVIQDLLKIVRPVRPGGRQWARLEAAARRAELERQKAQR